jgi:aryl-alcohol dehydrogenase-like predicted oxidoreductase
VNEFTHREVPRLGRRLFRLGLSGSFGLDEAGCREALERLQYVFQLYWLGKMSAFTGAVQEEMNRLREEGKVRALGVSIHDRPRAGKLVEESILDLLMIRYNAAHPGAEAEIFPHLARRRPAVVAYTATAWRKMLRAPGGWKGKVPTAGDCYRFCLASPHVDVVLTGPRNVAELRENLATVNRGPLSPAEMEEMRAFGRAVRG